MTKKWAQGYDEGMDDSAMSKGKSMFAMNDREYLREIPPKRSGGMTVKAYG